MFSRKFLLDALERAVSTFAQAGAASLVVTGLDDYKSALVVGAAAGFLAVAKAVAGSRIGQPDSASVVPGA